MYYRFLIVLAVVSICTHLIAKPSLDQLYKQAYDLRHSRPEQSLVLIQEYLKLSEDATYKGAGFFLQGSIYEENDQHHLALTSFFNSLLAYANAGRLDKMGSVSQNIGLIFFNSGSYEKAEEYFRKSLEYNPVLASKASNYYNLALVMRKQDHIDSAVYYLDESTRLRQQLRDWHGIVKNYNELGLNAFDINDFELAKTYYLRAISMLDENKQIELAGFLYNNLGNAYLNIGELDSAELLLVKAIVWNESNNLSALSGTCNNLAKISLARNDTALAKVYLLKSINGNDLPAKQYAYLKLIEIYEVSEIDSAYSYSKDLNTMAIAGKNETSRLEQEAIRYRLELVDAEYKARLKSEHERWRLYRVIAVSIIIILSILALILLWLRSVKRSARNNDGSLLKMVQQEAKFSVELLLYENSEKQKTIDEMKKSLSHKKWAVSKRVTH